MRGNKIKWIILFTLIFFPSVLIFSQTEPIQEILEKNKALVFYITALGDEKKIVEE